MALPKTLPPAALRGFCCFFVAAPGAEAQPAAFGHKSPLGPPTGPDLLSTAAAQTWQICSAAATENPAEPKPGPATPRPSPATQLPKTRGQDPALQRSCLKPRATPLQCSCRKPMPLPTSGQRQGQKMPALRAGLLHGRRPNLAPPAQRNRQKSHVGLQPYLLQLEPKMQRSAQAQLQSVITDSQLCSHVTRRAAAQIQFGIQSLRSAVATSDLPVSAPPHITDQICQLCAQSHSQSQITAQCSAHMS